MILPHFPLIVRQPHFDHYFPAHADLPPMPPEHLVHLHPQSTRLRQWFQTDKITDTQVARGRAAYYGLIAACDERVGMVLDALAINDLRENTVVIYTSDHGELHGEHGLWWKCSFYEASARVPLIVAWPGQIAGGSRVATVTSLIDVVRTMMDLAGADVSGLDGRGLLPLLRGDQSQDEGIAFCEYEGHGTVTAGRMVRRGRHKLNYYWGERPELFDLSEDPEEFHDLASVHEYASVRDELTALVLTDWHPEQIVDQVRDSQRRRRIITSTSPPASEYGWTPPHPPRA